jgi:hypothetical protein
VWGAPPPSDAGALPHAPLRVEITFDDRPGWSAGIDGYVGLSTLLGTDTRGAYSLAGALFRARYRYYALGAFFEATDTLAGGGQWQSVGGFAGAWLPYKNWVDFEVALRMGGRKFTDRDSRFGPSGYSYGGSALGVALGVSDRAVQGRWGGRVGASLVGTYDLKQRDRPWRFETVDPETGMVRATTGQSHVGGFSVALHVTIGLDLGEGG